jgi:hypothetical protein
MAGMESLWLSNDFVGFWLDTVSRTLLRAVTPQHTDIFTGLRPSDRILYT